MKIFKKYFQNYQIFKKFNEIKHCLNELKNTMISKSIFKKIKITILLLIISKNTYSNFY